ncbi:zf-HC2 domain-containing protein [Agaribacterium sp. ZY112]|uniref:zf-HC2 domain-containing protein n=1 Tax=Agaribacterium sp. ZY112 TaxID=3233574 RepID=UPI003525FC7A
MLSCKEVTRLLSLAQERPLSLGEKISLKFHLLMCKKCKRFNNNLGSLRAAMTQFKQRKE